MNLLIVIPKYNLTNKPNYNYAFPLGLAYIFTIVSNSKHNIECINLNHLNGTTEELLTNALNKKNYDIVCTGYMAIGYTAIEKIVKTAKKHISNPITIVGGSIITSEPKLMFNSLNPDFAIVGEGEITIIDLLDSVESNSNLNNVNGIMFREKNQIIITKPREIIQDLDTIPFPKLDELGFQEFLENQENDANFNLTDNPKPYTILCSRGCPYQCTFCYHSLGYKYRRRSIKNILEEIRQAVKKYNINSLEILDDLFSIDKQRVYDFCDEINKLNRGLTEPLSWSSQFSVNNIDKKLLEAVKEAGCNVISFGFESYSQKVLNSMKKPITPEQIDRAIKLTREVGLGLQGAFIFGDPAETKETAKETLDYWKKNAEGQIRLFFIQPYPGSELFNRCVEKRIIKDKLDFIKNKISHTTWINMTDKMTDKEILELKKEILEARRKYYPYTIPSKIKKTSKNKYEIEITCPLCKEKINYKNCTIKNRFYFNKLFACKNCFKRVLIVNRPYKFTMDYYNQLEFLRRNYLSIRDSFLKRKI